LLFLSTFRLSNRTPKIAQILTLHQANAVTLTPLSKEDRILIKSLQECKDRNAWQFRTEFLNKGWTKNSIHRLLMKFSTIDRRLGSGRRIARTDENVDTVESLRLSQEDKPQSQEKFHLRRGDPSIISFADYSQSSASQVLQARRAQQLTEAHSMHSLFSACSSRDDNVITSNPYMKTETCKLYSRAF